MWRNSLKIRAKKMKSTYVHAFSGVNISPSSPDPSSCSWVPIKRQLWLVFEGIQEYMRDLEACVENVCCAGSQNLCSPK